jgi:hypothetical protein
VPSKNDGTFTVDALKIPSNAVNGKWKINVSSGSNLAPVEFNVISTTDKGILISVTDDIDIPGFGKNIKISITTTQKTSITMNVMDLNGKIIGDSSTCTPTTDFKCEILWTIPKDTIPGTYIVRVNDSIIIEETTFEIK